MSSGPSSSLLSLPVGATMGKSHVSMSSYSHHQEPHIPNIKMWGSVLVTPLVQGTSSHFSTTTSSQRHYSPIGQRHSRGSSPSQRPSHHSDHPGRFSVLHPQTHSTPATVPLPLPSSHCASSLLQNGPLSSRARRLANEFLARHEESLGMLIVCWRISKRFGEIYTDFHVTTTKVAQTLPFLCVGVEGGSCPCICGGRE